ncbi:hypothetical protein ACWEN6_05810 [Sphaerisporangium sp. NPDC004334]
MFWLPWAYATAVHRADWNYYVAPFFVGMLLAVAVVLSWASASQKKYLSNGRGYLAWLAMGLPVAFMALVGWEGGYEVGGGVLAFIGVVPAVLVGWAFVLLWRHRMADWREHGQAGPN